MRVREGKLVFLEGELTMPKNVAPLTDMKYHIGKHNTRAATSCSTAKPST